ncbi:phosphoribosylglycinamide formyltransferase [Dermabacter sp. HMSC06F07]|uniref:Phosphoribosylglycinamide formyltransferase n=2 Tax=Dermabacter TaxID=36739 RepID=A0ABR4SNU9_9MICO|nr:MULTISPECIES: phosphoribosylglycinamide formyltransferase [Dermabacter]KDS94392.1 phosphoribosylglycinamide formyltransferase [Dermabacter hominis 1368]ATH97100.1 phosphoribosylglycinamide formyltransferase [Dermabacter jinjuensis]EPH15442.1 phosphoribosylglycinamide formyltransferase [Dermabacter sp. HFH0086]MCT1709993.1 phosphoribosylglycinamide formyltransferase [Dermabacter hominis]MCT2025574.1 phosphoribosylglycinamide formyltransferase [Dermabacter hominis]
MNDFTCVVFISGTGSNLRAILEAIEKGALAGVKVAAVIADVDAPGLSFARDRGIPAHVVPLADYSTREDWNRALVDCTAHYAPDLVVLAGFMRLLGAPMLEAFRGRIINTHPALLPAFPGAHGVRDALNYGVKVTGATVIDVDEGVDTGAIIDQRALTIRPGESEEELHERIKVIEREMLVDVIARRARNE